MTVSVYPWQAQQWQQLQQAKIQNRLAHALLFTGVKGLGKAHFADMLARSLVCEKPQASGDACNKCHACRLAEGRAHPDLKWVEPEKVGHAIKVDQIRELTEFVQQSTFKGNRRVVIINPANNLNQNAANALLKTLEEPSDGAVIILIADQRDRLLPTILSRCQTFIFTAPLKQHAADWLISQLKDKNAYVDLLLTLANGAPLAALQLAEENQLAVRNDIYQTLCDLKNQRLDPIKMAAKWKDIELEMFLDLVLSWLMDISRLQLGGCVLNSDFNLPLSDIAKVMPTNNILNLSTEVLRLRKAVGHGINLNKQLMMETILIHWINH